MEVGHMLWAKAQFWLIPKLQTLLKAFSLIAKIQKLEKENECRLH